MSIEKSKVIARIKAKHPNTNLSNARMDELAARLIKKLDADADDAAIDKVIDDANDYNPFSEIAKNDDRIRDLEAKAKPKQAANDDKKDDSEDKIEIPTDAPDYFKAIMSKLDSVTTELDGFKKGQQAKSLVDRFNSDERIKDVPDIMRRGFVPNSEDDYETNITGLLDGFTKYNESYKVEKLGGDTPSGNKGGEGQTKEASAEKVDAVVSKLKI